tara:strand:- start:1156 stop:1566 length:411 start_codon:yes stop_codon:yes gene_type:complete
MAFEGIICPKCSNSIPEEHLEKKLTCPSCGVNLKDKRFLGFLEFLMMQGIVSNIDFFDEILYGDEIKKNETEKEQKDETDPDEFEDKAEKMDRYDDINVDLHEVSTDEKEFRRWKGLEEDWQEFNKQDDNEVEGEA